MATHGTFRRSLPLAALLTSVLVLPAYAQGGPPSNARADAPTAHDHGHDHDHDHGHDHDHDHDHDHAHRHEHHHAADAESAHEARRRGHHDHGHSHHHHHDHDHDHRRGPITPGVGVIGNFYGLYNPRGALMEGGEEVGNRLRSEVELDFHARLLDYARGRVVLTFIEELVKDFEIELEEAYLDVDLGRLFQIDGPTLTLRGGKFRTPFGIINRLHPHELPHLSYPVAVHRFLGHEGDLRAGGQLRLRNPLGDSSAVILESAVVNGENRRLLAGEDSRHMSLVNHVAGDLTFGDSGTRLYIGASHLFGYSDRDARVPTNVLAGALRLELPFGDCVRLTAQAEAYYALKVRDRNDLLGWYGYLELALGQWAVGARFDQSDHISNEDVRIWGAGAYLTYRVAASLYVRVGYERYETNRNGENLDVLETIALQFAFILGSHQHDHDFSHHGHDH